MTKYLTVEQTLRNDAQKYVDRAKDYLKSNKIDNAIGCLEKARNKIKRANELTMKLDPLSASIFGDIFNRIQDAIAKDIMNGSGLDRIVGDDSPQTNT